MDFVLVLFMGAALGLLVEGLWGPRIREHRKNERRRKANAPVIEDISVVALHGVQNCPLRRLDAKHYREDGTCRCKPGKHTDPLMKGEG